MRTNLKLIGPALLCVASGISMLSWSGGQPAQASYSCKTHQQAGSLSKGGDCSQYFQSAYGDNHYYCEYIRNDDFCVTTTALTQCSGLGYETGRYQFFPCAPDNANSTCNTANIPSYTEQTYLKWYGSETTCTL